MDRTVRPSFDRKTVHDHYDSVRDLSAILCDSAARLVVHMSQPGRNACVIEACMGMGSPIRISWEWE